jgi:malate dehydrogenase (oxaloacetate-decarboxylating)(NADP+)
MVTGVTRPFGRCFDDITKVISPKNDESFLSMSMMVSKERTVFIGDVNIHDTPNAEQLANCHRYSKYCKEFRLHTSCGLVVIF